MRQYRPLNAMSLEEKQQEWGQIIERLINLGAHYFKSWVSLTLTDH